MSGRSRSIAIASGCNARWQRAGCPRHGMWTGHLARKWTGHLARKWTGHLARKWTGHLARKWTGHLARNPWQRARCPRHGGPGILPGAIPYLAKICCIATAVLFGFATPALTAPSSILERAIGIEGDVAVALPRSDYQPRPLDDRTPLILRVESVKPGSDGRFTYALHYIGLEPGTYQLSDYLVHPDGSLAKEIGGEVVQVRSVLPPDHDGVLNAYVPQPFPWFGGYRMFLGFLALLWLGGIGMFIYLGRNRTPVVVPLPVPPPPTYAQRMQPFVEAAAAGNLSATGQAELERLLTGFWRDKLALPERRMADALAQLKLHPEAGALLRALERWLHHPGGSTREEVSNLLKPYRQSPLAAAAGEEGA